jgi:formate-dependent phosphoribosylglycinamide formyltransferase (GAR transformylase)
MPTFAERAPVALGVKVTEIVQLALGASELVQPLLSMKSPAFVPVTAMLEIVRGVVPLFVSTTLFMELVPTA